MSLPLRFRWLLLSLVLVLPATGCARKLLTADLPLLPGKEESAAETERERLAVANMMRNQGEMQQAIAAYNAILEENPQCFPALHDLGLIYCRVSDFQTADRYFRQAFAIAPENTELLNDIGYMLFLQGNHQQAEETFQRALRFAPQNKRLLNNLAKVQAVSGNTQEALANFRDAGEEAQAYANLAYMELQRGEVHEAMKLYGRALSADPHYRPAADALSQLAANRKPLSERQSQLAQDDPNQALPMAVQTVTGQQLPRSKQQPPALPQLMPVAHQQAQQLPAAQPAQQMAYQAPVAPAPQQFAAQQALAMAPAGAQPMMVPSAVQPAAGYTPAGAVNAAATLQAQLEQPMVPHFPGIAQPTFTSAPIVQGPQAATPLAPMQQQPNLMPPHADGHRRYYNN